MKLSGTLTALTLILASGLAFAEQTGNPLDQGGWHTWQVKSVTESSDWCCYTWNAGTSSKTECDLDSSKGGYGNHDSNRSLSDTVQIYALTENGQITKLRALSPSCPVNSRRTITNLGQVESAASLAWIAAYQSQSQRDDDTDLMAIAAHSGPEASRLLVDVASDRSDSKRRQQAVFWMAQLKVGEMREDILTFIYSDPDTDMRKHALFSYAQSQADDRLDVLIDVIENRDSALGDRKNALFWLAQTDNGEGVDYIQDLLVR